jgi:Mn-containing catalase
MAGLLEEGQEVIDEEKYSTAKNRALQLHNSSAVQLLARTLGEEENADQLLDQIARSLMSVNRMPASVE